MRIRSIFFLFLLLGITLLFPKVRKIIWESIVNNSIIRRTMIRMGMNIPFIRERVVRAFYFGT